MISSAESTLKAQIASFKSKKVSERSFHLFPILGNPLLYRFHILPPKNSVYNGAMYKGIFTFPTNYPSSAPTVKFEGVIPFHPNVNNSNGEVCITFNSGTFCDLETVADSFHDFFMDPNFESPKDGTVKDFYDKDKAKYSVRLKLNVEASCEQHEIDDSDFPAWYLKKRALYMTP